MLAPLLEASFKCKNKHDRMFAMLCCCTLNSIIRWVVLKTRQFVSKLTVKRFLLKMLIRESSFYMTRGGGDEDIKGGSENF